MGWFSDFIRDPVGTTVKTAEKVISNPGEVIKDIGKTIDTAIIQPIKDDPLTFIAAVAAYSYGIPGLSFAGAGTAASVGIATTGSRLAQGDEFDEAIKKGATAAAFTAAGNYVKSKFVSGTGAIPDGSTAPAMDGSGASIDASSINNTSNYTGVEQNSFGNNAPAFDSSSATVLEPIRPADLVTTGSNSYIDPTQPNNPFAPKAPSELSLELSPLDPNPAPISAPDVNMRNLQGNPNASTPAMNANNPQMNSGQTGNSIYRSEFENLNAEKPYVPGSASQPATGTPDKYGPHPDYPNDPNMRVLVEKGQPGLPEVVDKSTLGGPASDPSLPGAAYDYAKSLGENAISYAVENPYTVAGGLYLASQLGNKDKPQDDGSGGNDPNKQVGDSRFYQPLQQLNMVQNYDPYKDDIYRYGQVGGEHQFLTSPIYVPVSYADGGQVGMPPVGPMQQQQYQSTAVGPMMAPAPAQQPMGALSQASTMGAKPSPLASAAPQQMQSRGVPQQVAPQQQNPAYRYFSYGQIPPSVTSPLQPVQQPLQNRATGGLAMAHGGNVPDGRTDDIPAMLSQGEYVMDAETVALLGNGNNDAGAKRLDHMREAIRKQKGGALSKGKISPDAQSPLAYLSRSMA